MKHKVKIKYLNEKCNIAKATEGSLAYDLRANISEPVTIKCNEIVTIPLGISTDLGSPLVGLLICIRSGLARKHGLQILNSPGIIDDDYRGEIGAIIHNTGATGQDFIIEPYDRIAQGLFISSLDVELEVVEDLSDTERGSGGYNSTGLK